MINILVIDDSETVRAVIRETLHLSGLELGSIFEASNGEEALGVLTQEWIDLTLADLNMPVMSGLELVEHMQHEELLRSIPVVVISTQGSRTTIESLRGRGISAYVRKPFTPEQIRAVVTEVLEVSRES